jgi:spore coat protein U-like protein
MKGSGTGILFLSILIFIFFLVEAGFAATATSNLNVSASVSSACHITSVGHISFGAYDPLSDTPTDAAGNVVFRCVKGTSYKTYITGDRIMSGGGDSLVFQLYNESGRTTVFPSDNAVSGITAASISPITKDIYGRISVGQDVRAANYTTTLITVVEY